MPQLDRLKEEVAYLKFWQGFAVVTAISLIGWLITTSESAPSLTIALAALGVALMSFGIVLLHRRIERRIDQIGKL